MILRNYYNWLAMLTMGISYTDVLAFGDGYLNAKRLSGVIGDARSDINSYALGLGRSVNTAITGVCESNKGSIIIGSGDTAVTFDDYALASIISSGWTKGTPTVGTPSYNSETKKWTNTISFLCTNTSGSTMTIKEVGIVTDINDLGATTSSLVYREVLATPIEITNGNSSTITLNLEYTMPTV